MSFTRGACRRTLPTGDHLEAAGASAKVEDDPALDLGGDGLSAVFAEELLCAFSDRQ